MCFANFDMQSVVHEKYTSLELPALLLRTSKFQYQRPPEKLHEHQTFSIADEQRTDDVKTADANSDTVVVIEEELPSGGHEAADDEPCFICMERPFDHILIEGYHRLQPQIMC